MSDLAKLYSSFMKDMGVDHIAHSSRLRDRLINACSYLQRSGKIGQDCLIPFQDDLDEVMRSASRHYDSDVAKVLRKDIFNCESSSWEQGLDDQNICTLLSLRTFLKMLLRGPGNISSAREEQSEAEQHGNDQHDDQVISTLSQLICYHTQKSPPFLGPLDARDVGVGCFERGSSLWAHAKARCKRMASDTNEQKTEKNGILVALAGLGCDFEGKAKEFKRSLSTGVVTSRSMVADDVVVSSDAISDSEEGPFPPVAPIAVKAPADCVAK
ncbi:hypothetical protein FQA39_LY16441 [Lamprigera yunnana]|nr:hypothetical protein FQA39_LY16441 [Lamprigera yunnana]